MRPTTARSRILDRLVAVWLVILIAVPFTAPFQTVALGAASSEAAVDASPAKDISLAASLPFALPGPSALARLATVRVISGTSDHVRILSTVLRV